MRIKTVLAIILFMITACDINSTYNKSGDAFLVFKMPNSSFNIKTIPINTDYLEITITGVGLEKSTDVIKTTVKASEKNKNNEIRLKIEKLPVGEKLVSIEAFDLKKQPIAFGKESINIVGGKLNSITIELKENVLPLTKISPSAIASPIPSPIKTISPIATSAPSASVSLEALKEDILNIKFTNIPTTNSIILAQLKDSNGRLFKGTFLNSNISFKDIPSGLTKLKATILSSDFIPLGKFEKEFNLDKDNKNLEFEAEKAITLPDFFEFTETETNLKAKIASAMKAIFNSYVLPDPNTTNDLAIKENDVEIFIDGKLYSTGTTFAINTGSSIKINIKQNKPNLKYIWAVTRYLPLKKIYQTNIRPERTNSLELKLVENLKDIHVFETDLKTMSNVINIPIEQFTN